MLKKIYTEVFVGTASAWTALFTCVLMVFSGLLWKVGKEANQTSMATQRAFITSTGLSSAVCKVPDNDGKKVAGYSFSTGWGNSGTTPTKTATYQNNVTIGRVSPTIGFDFDTLPQSEKKDFVFGPKQGLGIAATAISLNDMNAAGEGKVHIFFWGWAVYRDIFTDTPPHLTEYCIEVTDPKWTKPDHADITGDVVIQTPP